MNTDRAIEKIIFVIKNYCTTEEDREDMKLAIKALEFYRLMKAYGER